MTMMMMVTMINCVIIKILKIINHQPKNVRFIEMQDKLKEEKMMS